jgi:hypothetical protein
MLLEGTMDSSGTGTYDTSIGPAYVRNSNRESSMIPPDPMETDDVDDSLFIDLDVDQLVAKRQQESSRLSQSTETPFEYGHDWENNSSWGGGGVKPPLWSNGSSGFNDSPWSGRYSNGIASTISSETAF